MAVKPWCGLHSIKSSSFKVSSSRRGQTLVELLLALGLFAFIMTGVFALVFGGLTTNLRTEEQDYATMLAQEGLDAARSIRDTNWDTFITAADAPNTHGVANIGTGWSWSGANNEITYGARKYTREIFVEDVYRDANNNIFTGSDSADFDYTASSDYQCEGGACPSTNLKVADGAAKLNGNTRLDNSVNPKELTPDANTKALYHFNANEGKEINGPGDAGTDDPETANAVGLWHLNERSGTSAADSSANGNTAELASIGSWTKYASNPVLNLGAANAWDDAGIFGASVIKDGATYKMWYTGYDGAVWRIGYATSADGITWTKNPGNSCGLTGNGCIMNLGTTGTWDDAHVGFHTVIKDGTTYKMWYTGHDGANYRIGYATSADGIIWTKYASNPVLNLGAANTWDDAHVYEASVIKDGSTYKMWYTGHSGTNTKVGYATSADGIVWTKYASNPVLNLGAANTWMMRTRINRK